MGVQVFPAEVVGGVPALKAFAGPFRMSGLSRAQAHMAGCAYLALSNVSAVGSWLTPADLIRAGLGWHYPHCAESLETLKK